MMCQFRGVWYTENATSYNSHGQCPWQPPSYPKAGVTSIRNEKLCLFSVSRCEGVGFAGCSANILLPWYRPPVCATLEGTIKPPSVQVPHSLGSFMWACCVQWRCCASCGQSLREVLRVNQFSFIIFNRLSILTCFAITHIRLMNSYGLNHSKEGRRQRSFTCGLSSSVPECLPDALI